MNFAILVICLVASLYVSYRIGVISGYELAARDSVAKAALALTSIIKLITDRGVKLGYMKRESEQIVWQNNEPMLTEQDIIGAIEKDLGE